MITTESQFSLQEMNWNVMQGHGPHLVSVWLGENHLQEKQVGSALPNRDFLN